MEGKRKIIIFLNIFVLGALFFVLYSFQQYFYLVYHDYFIPYIIPNVFPDWGRIPASILYRITREFLPNFLSIHPQDFISGVEAIIKTISFLLICTIFSLGYFLTANKKYPILNFENILIFPMSFFLLGMPIFLTGCHNMYFGKIEESVVYFEYFFCFLFYFSFYIFLIYLILTLKDINNFKKFLMVLNSFLLGFWVEIFNVSTFFSIIIFLILIGIFYKKSLKNKYLWLLIIPFVIGMFCFYIFSGYSTGTKLLAYSYNWDTIFYNLKHSLYDFIKEYIRYMFWKNKFIYLIIIMLSFFLWKKRKSNINIILITCFSILLGYLIMNLCLIIYIEPTTIHRDGFLFEREQYQILMLNVLEFVIVILLGAFYFEYFEYRKRILAIIFLIDIILLSTFLPNYSQVQISKSKTKQLVYAMEKSILVYSILGETAILPASYLKRSEIFSREIFMLDDQYKFSGEAINSNIVEYSKFMKNKYFNSLYFFQTFYLEDTYNRKFKGVMFVDDNIAKEELNKRLELLNFEKETKDDLLKSDISFNKLNNYKNFKLTFSNIKNLDITKENKDILLKAKAYLYYREGRLNKSLKLYLQYLKKEPKDYDALYNVADIYVRKNDIKKAENIYLKLTKLDSNNLSFLYKLLKIYYYEKKDYKKALNICNKMIKIQDNMWNLYINKAVIYLAMKNTKKANEVFKFVEDKDINKINDFCLINEINEKDDIYKKKVFVLLEPRF